MRVRCGRCQAEVDIAGAGEFLCPDCGTRNVVRGTPPPSPFDLPSIGGTPPRGPAGPAAPDPAVRWVDCPACSFRFAAGATLDAVMCPNCRESLALDDSGARIDAS